MLGIMAGAEQVFVLGLLGAIMFWGISMLDLLIALIRYNPVTIIRDEFGRPMEIRQEKKREKSGL